MPQTVWRPFPETLKVHGAALEAGTEPVYPPKPRPRRPIKFKPPKPPPPPRGLATMYRLAITQYIKEMGRPVTTLEVSKAIGLGDGMYGYQKTHRYLGDVAERVGHEPVANQPPRILWALKKERTHAEK